jgi:hypothetical protein
VCRRGNRSVGFLDRRCSAQDSPTAPSFEYTGALFGYCEVDDPAKPDELYPVRDFLRERRNSPDRLLLGMGNNFDLNSAPALFALLKWLFRQIARLGDGYSGPNNSLWEGHHLATSALLCYLGVYLFLFPLTAPAPQPVGYPIALGGLAPFSGLLSIAFFKIASRQKRIKLLLVMGFTVLSLLAIAFLCVDLFRGPFSFEAFPVLESVLVLVTLLLFIFAVVAFWADRHRIPVFTSFIVYLLFIHHLHIFPKGGDHFFRAREFAAAPYPAPLHPAEVFRKFCRVDWNSGKPCPIIVVVATGGGIHAASWTATVLTQLELDMQKDGFTFHDHLFYANAVSGGSEGLVPFFREYYSPTPFSSGKPTPNQDHPKDSVLPYWAGRIRRAANYSSLEAVGWGLEYSDFLHIVFPLPADPDFDRSSALETAFGRNVTLHC